jgi:hypothetical protein
MKHFAAANFLALTLTFTVCSSNAITINGQDALPLIKLTPEGKQLKCIPNKEVVDNVSLRINKGAIEITPVTVDAIEAEIRIPLRFAAIQKDHKRLDHSERLRSFRTITGQSISFKEREISEKERISVEASMDIQLENVILQSPNIILAAKQLKFNNCFCGSKYLLVMSTNPKSLYKAIVFSFDEKCLSHTAINGKIDFETDTGELEILNVKEINIVFSERAFE